MKQYLLLVFLTLSLGVSAQTAQPESKAYVPQKGEFEFFVGAELHYRDLDLDYPYDVLIYLTPGIKWHLPYHIQIAAQGQIPIVNTYGDYYKYPRLSNLTVSEQFRFGSLALKPTIGVFSQERYGIDLKAMLPVANWFAFEAQIGLTGYLSMAQGWQMSKMKRLLALGGGDIYLNRWNVQLRGIGGRFMGGDYGFYVEGMRHFRHCTVGIWGDYSNQATMSHGFNGGFKITMAIPPYKRRHRKVTFRPASDFQFSFNMNADNLTNKVYNTDPEENSRQGWFSPDILPWGANQIPDQTEKEVQK